MILVLVTLAYLGYLLVYEGWAVATHHKTISTHMREAQAAWPLLIPLAMFVIGGLLVHFLSWV